MIESMESISTEILFDAIINVTHTHTFFLRASAGSARNALHTNTPEQLTTDNGQRS